MTRCVWFEGWMVYDHPWISGYGYSCYLFGWMDRASQFTVWLHGYLLNREAILCLVGWISVGRGWTKQMQSSSAQTGEVTPLKGA